MKSAVVKVLRVFVILAAFGATQVVTAAGKLPLKHGIYVREGVPCDSAATADTINFDGNGFGGAHASTTITDMLNNGNVYYITQKYQGLGGVGGEGTWIGQLKVTIKGITSFSISDVKIGKEPLDKRISTYRYCHD